MTMFSMKPQFNLPKFLAESAPKKGAGPRKSQQQESPVQKSADVETRKQSKATGARS
ncbi:MAG: hypothetical protein HUJ27_11575 [Rhodobacteraceae bacterium]|nr:hypothetical protein [Paracoccaceae bacterium]